jgi:CRISPR/Cas system-associated endonuclease Cas1
MLRAIVFFGLATSAFASATLDVLVNAASSFLATIQQQLEMLQSDPSPAELAEKTVDYAEAKAAYFKALSEEVPELLKIATGKEARPPELDTVAAAKQARSPQ